MTLHTYRPFDEELAKLRDQVLLMGGMVERAIQDCMTALIEVDDDLAQLTIERDSTVNSMEIESDHLARQVIIRYQPVGRDLRAVMGAIKAVTDLERMGDLAVDICRESLGMERRTREQEKSLVVMADRIRQQVCYALRAFSIRDYHYALTVIDLDQYVDILCRNYERAMMAIIMKDRALISAALALINIAKALERISDHATNICEMVIYIRLGHDIRHLDREQALKVLNLEEGDWTPPTQW
ncbi:MAG: phosphate signaling complex protein PhoU [Mariprofundales bacterium]|nr:phosphate signaling complex protein PhoU [Mariprofundales bacterium]